MSTPPQSLGSHTVMDEVLFRAGLFQGVSREDAEELADHFEVFEAARGTKLFDEGDLGDCLYVVLMGSVKLTHKARNQREALLAIMGPADEFGELSVFDPGPRTATAVVLTDSKLARVNSPEITQWVRHHPELALQLLRVVARRLRRTNATISDLIFMDVPGRVAKELVRLAQRFGSYDDGVLWFDQNLTQNELAQLVGASRETVNKALSDFAQRGWIRLESKRLIILDRERLFRRAAH